ncbi:hypothetical protein Palpr_2432 [Paludibacter propionicigenes WB4]|uniref:Outer membrane protein beta-barrel domain-containing protein n=2 Tax=Paludibacter TaxID=346096 RepID=E4T770_PALPW|nr:hypothetical protein Palpr_2432 [Paludibacter propionicigenes WB4]
MCVFSSFGCVLAQNDSLRVKEPARAHAKSYEVKSAVEVESLVPMFLTGGFHIGVGYRYERFRVRVSVINGGSYDAETAGVNNSSADFKRFYKTSPGLFLGYNLWRNLELYSYLEAHTFEIEQKSTGIRKDMHSLDTGLGLSYQFFIGRYFYIQPGMHVYLRGDKTVNFETASYSVPNVDLSPVVRLGVRLWSKDK